MKSKTKTLVVTFLLLCAAACTKENISKTSSAPLRSSAGSNAVTAFTIGQHYHGGIIFYIDGTGQHGLIAAETDQGTGIAWRKNKNIVTGATGTAVGTGLSNTKAIVAAQGSSGNYAALLCLQYVSGTFKNWYLPSKAELNLLYKKKDVIGNLSATNYWSSSEVSKVKAWDQEFGGGFQFKDYKSFTLNVRAISSF